MRARSEELNGLLRGLKLSTMAETYSTLSVRAAREGLTHEQYLYELAIQERQARDVVEGVKARLNDEEAGSPPPRSRQRACVARRSRFWACSSAASLCR